jgi:hypothetical protein
VKWNENAETLGQPKVERSLPVGQPKVMEEKPTRSVTKPQIAVDPEVILGWPKILVDLPTGQPKVVDSVPIVGEPETESVGQPKIVDVMSVTSTLGQPKVIAEIEDTVPQRKSDPVLVADPVELELEDVETEDFTGWSAERSQYDSETGETVIYREHLRTHKRRVIRREMSDTFA